MRLHGYLDELLGRKVSVILIQALVSFSGEGLTIRSLASQAEVSSSEASVVVKQLEKYGIVKVQPAGKSHLVMINEQSYIVNKIIRPMLRAEQETIPELISILRKYLSSEDIFSAIIFGNVSKREENNNGYVDILVVADDRNVARELISKAEAEIFPLFNVRISPLIWSREQFFAKQSDPSALCIFDGYMLIAGKDPHRAGPLMFGYRRLDAY